MSGLEFVESTSEEFYEKMLEVHMKIWNYAEISSEEYESANLLCTVLEDEGFIVRRNVCGNPTAFIASYGSGHPVVGFLGEYDALPGLSQQAGYPFQKPIEGAACGHGCGHSALGVASLVSAFLAKRYLERTGKSGTVKFYGCCSEEQEGIKPLMARDGEFSDTDCVFAWHPASINAVSNTNMIAVKMFDVEFKGTTAHAGAAPHLGRSALDACELMNVGVNYLREHVIQEARLQYAYLDAGGMAPNVVQDHAKMIYGVRAPKMNQVVEIIDRVIDCAKGAALMTGTTFEITPRMGYSDVFQNSVVAQIMSDAAQEVGAPQWTEEDFKLAKEFTDQYNPTQRQEMETIIKRRYGSENLEKIAAKPLDTNMEAFDINKTSTIYGCSDVGDVGYVTPTASLSVATCAIGAPGHSWFMTGMTGSTIGEKGLMCAGKIMGLAGIKVYDNPALLTGAQEERIEKAGSEYTCRMYN